MDGIFSIDNDVSRRATCKILRQSGGVGLYAKVTVVYQTIAHGPIVALSGDEFRWLKEVYGPNAWEWSVCDDFCRGAIFGVHYALTHTATALDYTRVKLLITSIGASPADTNADIVAYAACHATWEALDVQGIQPPEIVRGQVTFPATA